MFLQLVIMFVSISMTSACTRCPDGLTVNTWNNPQRFIFLCPGGVPCQNVINSSITIASGQSFGLQVRLNQTNNAIFSICSLKIDILTAATVAFRVFDENGEATESSCSSPSDVTAIPDYTTDYMAVPSPVPTPTPLPTPTPTPSPTPEPGEPSECDMHFDDFKPGVTRIEFVVTSQQQAFVTLGNCRLRTCLVKEPLPMTTTPELTDDSSPYCGGDACTPECLAELSVNSAGCEPCVCKREDMCIPCVCPCVTEKCQCTCVDNATIVDLTQFPPVNESIESFLALVIASLSDMRDEMKAKRRSIQDCFMDDNVTSAANDAFRAVKKALNQAAKTQTELQTQSSILERAFQKALQKLQSRLQDAREALENLLRAILAAMTDSSQESIDIHSPEAILIILTNFNADSDDCQVTIAVVWLWYDDFVHPEEKNPAPRNDEKKKDGRFIEKIIDFIKGILLFLHEAGIGNANGPPDLSFWLCLLRSLWKMLVVFA